MENSNTRALEQKSDKQGTTEEYIPQAATACISSTPDSKARETTTTRNRRVVDRAEDKRSQKLETLGKENNRGEGERRGQGLRVLLIHFSHPIIRDASLFVLFYLMKPCKTLWNKRKPSQRWKEGINRSRVFFCGQFSPLGDKKKRAGESNKGIFVNFFKKIAISWEKKVRCRQI